MTYKEAKDGAEGVLLEAKCCKCMEKEEKEEEKRRQSNDRKCQERIDKVAAAKSWLHGTPSSVARYRSILDTVGLPSKSRVPPAAADGKRIAKKQSGIIHECDGIIRGDPGCAPGARASGVIERTARAHLST